MKRLWTVYLILRRSLGRINALLCTPRWAREMGGEVMGRWGEPFIEDMIYNIGSGKRMRVRKTFIDHFPTRPFMPCEVPQREVADTRTLLGVDVDGDVSPENAVAVRDWILGGLITEVPEFLRIAANLKPKGERIMGEKIELGSKVRDTITGTVGTATARCVYFSGTGTRLIVEGMAEGKPFEMWVEESRCEVVAE
jgi:hypothetical protein